jgi:hypothetical protein
LVAVPAVPAEVAVVAVPDEPAVVAVVAEPALPSKSAKSVPLVPVTTSPDIDASVYNANLLADWSHPIKPVLPVPET